MRRFLKAFFTTILVIIILFVGSTFYYLFKNHIENPGNILSEIKNSDNQVEFLLLGVDSLDSSTATNTRTDTIMVVKLDLENGNASLVSVPRDTYTAIQGHKAQKINAAYNFGGPELTLDTVNNLLGTDIKHYLVMDYGFVEDMVNIIGGVTVDVPMKMDYEDTWADPPLKIHLEPGVQKLNGNEAIQFLRFRHGYVNQDLGRVEAQRQFVSAFMDKIKSPTTILKAPLLLKSYDKYTRSNMPFSEIIKIGMNMRKFSTDSISSETLPGAAGYRNRVSYFFVNKAKTAKLIQELGIN